MKYKYENNAITINITEDLNNKTINEFLNFLNINSKNKDYLISGASTLVYLKYHLIEFDFAYFKPKSNFSFC